MPAGDVAPRLLKAIVLEGVGVAAAEFGPAGALVVLQVGQPTSTRVTDPAGAAHRNTLYRLLDGTGASLTRGRLHVLALDDSLARQRANVGPPHDVPEVAPHSSVLRRGNVNLVHHYAIPATTHYRQELGNRAAAWGIWGARVRGWRLAANVVLVVHGGGCRHPARVRPEAILP